MKRTAILLVLVLLIVGFTYSGIVLAADNWSEDYAETSGTTLDMNPGDLTVVSRTCSSLTVQITKDVDAPLTLVRYSDSASPTTRTSGYEAYALGPESVFTFSPAHPVGSVGGHIYYLSAWGYSDELGFSENYTTCTDYTLPCDPSSLAAYISADGTRVDLSWTRGVGGDTTYIYMKANSYPTSRADASATLAYSSTAESASVTGLAPGTTYYFRAWAYDTDSGYYSSGYSEAFSTTAGNPAVTTRPASSITPVTAILNGYINSSGGSNCWYRFQWGTDNVDENSTAWEIGSSAVAIDYHLAGLTILTTYKFRAQVYNLYTTSAAPVSGSTLTFTTCSAVDEPTYLYADPGSSTTIDLSWIPGDCSDRTIVRYSATGYPTSENSTDGLEAYYGAMSTYSLTGLKSGTTYYFRAWGAESTGTYISDNYAETMCTTPSGGGGSVPYKFTDTSNWFTDPDCSRITGVPFYDGVANAATGIGWDVCVAFCFLIFIAAILAGLAVAYASKGNLLAVLVVMGLVLLIGVVAGPIPKFWFVIYLVFSIPMGYLLPKGASV